MIRRPPRSTLSSSSAASDVYKRQVHGWSHDDQLQLSQYALKRQSSRILSGLCCAALLCCALRCVAVLCVLCALCVLCVLLSTELRLALAVVDLGLVCADFMYI
eukprot:TRINITY_DN4468_c0_g1_i1.p1 TRINITY_DN4468_c0_g1~~TRINITY_DN4468_c0_g1_i1.p1  ORF type:complete len:104 (-),score=22.16 TRINITY_DN4468_c0_g1_i1:15-326(-)